MEPPPPVSEAVRREVRAQLGALDNEAVIVVACRMEAWKGHRLLLDALARLRSRPGWRCWVAGGAQRPEEQVYLADLKRRAGEAGISDRVHFLGQRSDVYRLLAAADIHCQPNLGPEPFGIAFVEALYSGLPCVSTAMGGAQEIISDRCGVLVPPDDPEALANALEPLLKDPVRRRALGASGPLRAREFCDPTRQVSLIHDTLRRLAAQGPILRGGPRRGS